MSSGAITTNFHVKVKINKSGGDTKNAFFIEGGGTKGVYAVGVLKYMFDYPETLNLDNVDIFGGTSVGSYLATALCLGMKGDSMSFLIDSIDISQLIDSPYALPLTVYRFLRKNYLYDDQARYKIAEKIISLKINDINRDLASHNPFHETITPSDLTFGHLRTLVKTNPSTYTDLLINAVDLNRQTQIFFTTLEDRWDNIKIITAMLASSAIPFVFEPTNLFYDMSNDRYGYSIDELLNLSENLSEKSQFKTSIIVDGGTSTNNPLDYFLLNKRKMTDQDYDLWILKFSGRTDYVEINGVVSLITNLMNYLIGGKNDVKTKLIEEYFDINTIVLKTSAGSLDTYTHEEAQIIIQDIYRQCCDGRFQWKKD
jgi:predicted acylesterase/phospholipase RssA